MREAWVMRLKPGSEAIYQEKHDNIWPEMLEVMQLSGIRNYSIYRHGLTLFAYLERDEPAAPDAAPDPVVLRWWKSVRPGGAGSITAGRHPAQRGDPHVEATAAPGRC